MKKIILSLSIIAVVAIAGTYATVSYFSDTETSTGNTFTAGSIDLTVDSEQHYNGNICDDTATPGTYVWEGTEPYPVPGTHCNGTWEATDLGAETFFNFNDIKPGDFGENTISLHVDSNDAYACVDINITKNDDVDCTDPECIYEGGSWNGTTCTGGTCQDNLPGEFSDGELAANIEFTAWADDGDNIWEPGEALLFTDVSGPASNVLGGKTYTLADSTTGPLTGGETKYIGLAWCAGKMTVSGYTNTNGVNVGGTDPVISCDGAEMKNDCQSDSMEATIAFRVEQARHNDNFTCN